MKKQKLYGMLGVLSLLGLVGVFTETRSFLAFFAFAVDFQYFFLPADEMTEARMARAGARAFVVGMLSMAAVTLGMLTLGAASPDRALTAGCTAGWALSVVVFSLLCAWGELRESWGLIRNRMKEHRARLGLKQEDLARMVGVRRETIGNLEKGRYNPSLVLAWNIAAVFGVSIEEVFTVEAETSEAGSYRSF